jgi:hypothetical protein
MHTTLPEDLMARLDLLLWSDFEGRVPKGAYQKFFEARMREFFSWGRCDLSLRGFPSGTFVIGPKEFITQLEERLK